jgi:hypothetical protein
VEVIMKPENHDYEGHRIEFFEREGKGELLIDNNRVQYGQLPNGQYFLHEYPFDWSDDLIEVARRFLKYRERVDKVRREHASRKGGE